MYCFGYHTCADSGEYDYILNNIPFYAKTTNKRVQWLSDGYYFWTDSGTYAKHWKPTDPKTDKPTEDRVIGKFSIDLEAGEVLDLVGNVAHQEHFINLGKTILSKLKNNPATIANATVSDILNCLRKLHKDNPDDELFPYKAIKAMDNRQVKPVLGQKFDTNPKNRLRLKLVTPQQICVFDKGSFTFECFVSPESFVNEQESRTKAEAI